MKAYFDTAYIAKCYVNEPDSDAVRGFAATLEGVSSAAICVVEVAAAFHRHAREGRITRAFAKKLFSDFVSDVDGGVWTLLPLPEERLRAIGTRVTALPDRTPIRAADAMHLFCAKEHGFDSVWTNDRQMLAAAPAFGLRPKSV